MALLLLPALRPSSFCSERSMGYSRRNGGGAGVVLPISSGEGVETLRPWVKMTGMR